MDATAEAHVFPDVNVLLHFPAFDGLDWRALVNARRVVIHLAQPVIGELNKVKDTGRSKAVRNRATSVQKRIKQLLNTHGLDAFLTDEVRVRLEPRVAPVDPHQGLNAAVADDVLIAQVMAFRSETDSDAVLVTDDDGLGLMIKASHWGIRCIEPPEEQRLRSEVDATERENEQLRRRLDELQRGQPQLSLAFADGLTRLEFEWTAEQTAHVGERMTKLREKYPPLSVPELSPEELQLVDNMNRSSITALLHPLMQKHHQAAAARRYNDRLGKFFGEYEAILRRNSDIRSRSIQLDLVLKNSGPAIAISPLVRMHFPDGFKLVKKKEIGDVLLDLPEPPHRPGEGVNFVDRLSFPSAAIKMPDIDALTIERTQSYDVAWHETKVRQHDFADIDPMFVFFDSDPFSFGISYEIVADNLHGSVTGRLDVVALSK